MLTVVGLQGQPAREFKVGYLPHEAAAAGTLVFVSNYGNAHVRSSDLTNDPGNLDRDVPIELGVASPRNLSHASGANRADNLV